MSLTCCLLALLTTTYLYNTVVILSLMIPNFETSIYLILMGSWTLFIVQYSPTGSISVLRSVGIDTNTVHETETVFYAFFWVISQRLNFICRCFGTHCLFHLHRWISVEFYTYPPMKMEQTECSETSAYKIQTPGNYPEESIQHLEHGKSLKSRDSVTELI